MNLSPWQVCLATLATRSKCICLFCIYLYRFCPSCSNTMITCCLNLKWSNNVTIYSCPSLSPTFFPYSLLTIRISTKALSTSNFLFFEILTATTFELWSLQSTHLRTYPKAPVSIYPCTTYLYPSCSPCFTTYCPSLSHN